MKIVHQVFSEYMDAVRYKDRMEKLPRYDFSISPSEDGRITNPYVYCAQEALEHLVRTLPDKIRLWYGSKEPLRIEVSIEWPEKWTWRAVAIAYFGDRENVP